METGALVISLDFELAWGLKAYRDEARCQSLALGAREVIPGLLDLLAEHQAHATWAEDPQAYDPARWPGLTPEGLSIGFSEADRFCSAAWAL